MLLDLLGAPEPRFYNYFPDTEGWYYQLVDIESRLGASGFLVEHAHNSAQRHKKHHQGYFQPYSVQMGIEDDHIPFLRRNVSVTFAADILTIAQPGVSLHTKLYKRNMLTKTKISIFIYAS